MLRAGARGFQESWMRVPREVMLVSAGFGALAGWAPASGQTPITQSNPIMLENEYVRVSKDVALCASATPAACEDRVILAMGDLTLTANGTPRAMKRGDVARFKAEESFEPPSGPFYEVTVKPDRPPTKAPPELIAAPNNLTLFDSTDFFIYEERLPVGQTRPRHSHSQRIEIRINQGPQLQQRIWREGREVLTEPSVVNWREPIVHEVQNTGDQPLRNFILEFKPPSAPTR
jgi:hypothetical protein